MSTAAAAKRMRIAYIVPYVPNLIRTRPYNLITQLSALGHEVTVFTLGSNHADQIEAQRLKSHCHEVEYFDQPLWRSLWNSATALPSERPLQSVYSWQPAMAREIVKRASRNEFDIVQIEHLRGSRFGLYLKSRLPNLPVVWDSVDCISHLFQQAAKHSSSFFGTFMTRFELGRTRKAEGHLACRFDHVLVTALSDKNALLELVPKGMTPSKLSVLPNGVDLEYFRPNANVQREPETLVFSGKMSYHANISMAKYLVQEIMPRIWKVRPNVVLYIVGKDPNPTIKKMMENPLIRVTGTVDDIRPFLWRATVSVVPLLYGAGIQNKILEAMATGTPVVTTCQALSALQAQPGKDLFASDDPDGFSQAVLGLIADRDLQQQTGDAGSQYVRTFHSWSSIASRLVNVYQQTLGNHSE
ncbi:MAG TPA: glycosyltransferase [Anaerolineales bacterium]|nr:glycosyltransferase [Anaerolineales bacterium]